MNNSFFRGILHSKDSGGVKGAVKAEIILLDPLTFKVDVQRNLSVNWHTQYPEIELVAALESINVSTFTISYTLHIPLYHFILDK